MRIIALLAFYAEPAADLLRCAESLELAGVDHLVAVDGRYAAFPEQATDQFASNVLRFATRANHMGLTLHEPMVPWAGNECEKRTFMHRLAHAVGEAGDWHFVIDADERVDVAPADLRDTLRAATERVARVLAREVGGGEGERRRLFRQGPWPVEVGPSHCRYTTSGEIAVLADTNNAAREVSAAWSGLVLSHGRSTRDEVRLMAKTTYYDAYPEGGHALCETGCGRAATQRARTGWRYQDGELLSDPLDACQWCADELREAGTSSLRAMGFDSDRVAL